MVRKNPPGRSGEASLTLGKSHPTPGSRPGTLVVPKDALAPTLRAFSWEPSKVEEAEGLSPRKGAAMRRPGRSLWMDIQGLGDHDLLLDLGDAFGLHPLALEDAVNVPQRPTSQLFDEHHLIIVQAVHPRSTSGALVFEQLSLFVARDYLVTVQQLHDDQLEPVRNRLRQGGPRIRRGGTGYLAYALLDAVLDAYFRPIEEIGEVLEELEAEVLNRPSVELLGRIHRVKKELLLLRRVLWPSREALNSLIRDDSPFFEDSVRVYLRDCYDHAVQLLDIVEAYREHCVSLMSTYLSAVGNRTNDVMKVLTIMASIFIPLTFLAGIYGMNFERMPELAWPWAYPALLSVMALVGGGLFVYFRSLGWIGGSSAGASIDREEPK